MKFAIQRRNIILAPPSDDDLDWFFRRFDDPEIITSFGFQRGSRMTILRAFRHQQLITGIIQRVDPAKRIGFIILFPPSPSVGLGLPEYGYAVPDPQDRDGYGAMSACDAFAHYFFDHLGRPALQFRTREGNRAADAVIRRLGYQAEMETTIGGLGYTFYRTTQALWQKRRERLERGEAEHPSGVGGAFKKI